MDERPGVSETHNLVITNYLTNHQIKSMCFFKLDTHRTVYRSKKEHRYFTCVVLASRCLLKMVAIFQDGHHEQLG